MLMSYSKPGGMSGGNSLPKPRGPMLTDKMPMTGPAQLSKPPAMTGPRKVGSAFSNRKMTGAR